MYLCKNRRACPKNNIPVINQELMSHLLYNHNKNEVNCYACPLAPNNIKSLGLIKLNCLKKVAFKRIPN